MESYFKKLNTSEGEPSRDHLLYFHILDLFSIILIVYFFILSWVIPLSISEILPRSFLGTTFPNILIDKILLPILISFFWLLIISQERKKITEALFIFKKIIGRLSFFQQAFYSLNFLIALFLIILPFTSILLSLFMLFYIPYSVAHSRFFKDYKLLSFLFGGLIFILISLLTFVPLLRLVYFLAEGWLRKLFLLWINPQTIKLIHGISLSIGGVGAINSFITFIYEGAHEYNPQIDLPYFKINLGCVLLSIIFSAFVLSFTVYFSSLFAPFLIFLSILVLLYPFERLIRYLKGMRKPRNPLDKVSIVLLFTFSLAGLGNSKFFIQFLEHFMILEVPKILKISSMVTLLILSIITFLYAFKKASKSK